MISKKEIADLPVANYDSDRKGIFIHRNQLSDSSFNVGDRFSVKVGKQDLFAISIVKDDKGDIIYYKNGIFIKRTRRIDILLGGIYHDSARGECSGRDGATKQTATEAVIKNNYM